MLLLLPPYFEYLYAYIETVSTRTTQTLPHICFVHFRTNIWNFLTEYQLVGITSFSPTDNVRRLIFCHTHTHTHTHLKLNWYFLNLIHLIVFDSYSRKDCTIYGKPFPSNSAINELDWKQTNRRDIMDLQNPSINQYNSKVSFFHSRLIWNSRWNEDEPENSTDSRWKKESSVISQINWFEKNWPQKYPFKNALQYGICFLLPKMGFRKIQQKNLNTRMIEANSIQ